MRKRVIGQTQSTAVSDWLPVERLAQVEVTSEDPAHPIESALVPDGRGWRAAEAGQQIIRLLFDQPQQIRRIQLVFREEAQACTQEFVLRWSADRGKTYREIVRQQYNFSPAGSTEEVEEYEVEINSVTALELNIIPDVTRRSVLASLHQLRLA